MTRALTGITINEPPLVVHVIYRLAVGGLENGLVNLINRMPPECYRHAIVCIDGYTDFRERIERDDVEIYSLSKKPGHDFAVFWRFWRLARYLRPAIVHTRNLNALEFQLPAILAGVHCRVQGEHGRDTSDIHGVHGKYLLLRRLLHPLVSHFIALSKDLAEWLEKQTHVAPVRISQIYNGVDTERFCPRKGGAVLPLSGFVSKDSVVIGTVGRMQGEKDQLTLVKAFLTLLDRVEQGRDRLRLVLIGDGPLRKEAELLLREAGVEHLAWLPGCRNDMPQLLQGIDIFVLPSLIEGVSNTILEAMATGLPVVATTVGGNPELVIDGETGLLVPPSDMEAMADALQSYVQSAPIRRQHGLAGRLRVEKEFSMEAMVAGYLSVYDGLLGKVSTEVNFLSEK